MIGPRRPVRGGRHAPRPLSPASAAARGVSRAYGGSRDARPRPGAAPCIRDTYERGRRPRKRALLGPMDELVAARRQRIALTPRLAELDSGEVGDTADALAASLSIIGHLRGRSPRSGPPRGRRPRSRAHAPGGPGAAPGGRKPRAEGRIREPIPDIRRRGAPTRDRGRTRGCPSRRGACAPPTPGAISAWVKEAMGCACPVGRAPAPRRSPRGRAAGRGP